MSLTADEVRPVPRVPGRALPAWALGLALITPLAVPYLTHFFLRPPGQIPTGFLQYDMPSYMAKAREYFDDGAVRLSYANPSSPSYDSPPIYFQPWTFALGAVARVTGADPAAVFIGFGVIAAWAYARVAVALYGEVVGWETPARRLGLVLFFWGGGLLAIAGLLRVALLRLPLREVFAFDPGKGWWALNAGRNIVYPTEALYHALFLGGVYLILRGRFATSVLVALLLSACHPFTGLELALTLGVWGLVEVGFLESGVVPRGAVAGYLGVLALHLAYYLGVLALFAEHRAVMRQWELPWNLDAVHFVPAYALVGACAAWPIRRYRLARRFFARPRNRLFLTWFAVAFALANHEFAIRPRQPLHFTKGYIWIPLFLMGAETIVGLLGRALGDRPRWRGLLVLAAIGGVWLSDNLLWFAAFPARAAFGRPSADVVVTPDQRAVLRWLGRHYPRHHRTLVLSQDRLIGELVITYTPLRSWVAHAYETPEVAARGAELEALFRDGTFQESWETQPVLVVLAGASGPGPPPSWLTERGARPVFRAGGLQVFEIASRRARGAPDSVTVRRP
jgi:hypothetical protein